MDNIVAATFELLRPHLSPVLFNPAAVRHLQELAQHLVPLPAARFGFECRLGAEASQVDLQQGIGSRDGEPLILARFVDRLLPTLPAPAAQIWRRVGSFFQTLEDPTSILHDGLRDIWLEFDVTGESSHNSVPSIFLGLRDEVTRPAERLAIIESALGVLTEDGIAQPVRDTLRRCYEVAPAAVGATHVGLMLSRPSSPLRLNIVGLSAAEAPDYLERVGWPGNLIEARTLIGWLMRLPGGVRVCLDVGAQVQPNLGFECLLADARGTNRRMEAVLDVMVSRRLCTEEKRDALLAWPGSITPQSCAGPWPSRLIGDSLLRKRNEFSVLDRQFSHIKVSYAPQRGSAGLEAKAYFGALYTWVQPSVEPDFGNAASAGQIRDAIERAIAFFRVKQLPYGEFPSYRFTNAECTTKEVFDSSPFVTCFALETLALAREVVDSADVEPMISKGIEFLLEEREEPGIWRYNTTRNLNPIDADLDDTCCASFTLRRLAGESSIAGNQAVILANRNAEGLFKTWLRPQDAPNVIDMVVNANVVLYLGERPETAAAIEKLNQVIEAGAEESSYWYYLSPLALYYMVSRADAHGVSGLAPSRQTAIRKTREHQKSNGSFGNEVLTGLGLCTLLNYGIRDDTVERALGYLTYTQQRRGSWRCRAFYAGSEPPNPHEVWWGAEAMTTALCLEGLLKSLKG